MSDAKVSPAIEHIARALCLGSNFTDHCPHCEDGQCTMWNSFVGEANVSLEATRDYYTVQRRDKPKVRSVHEIVRACKL
jgi:hypothetical protein